MSFDVPKLVRSPGCDHGHDEESRNGRDINIDILDGYIRTPKVFRVILEKTGEPEGYRNPPGEVMGHMGLSGEKRRGGQGSRVPPPPLVRIGQGGGRRPPFAFSSSLPSFPSPTPTRKGGVLLPVGVGLPPWRALLLGRPPPLLLYIQGQGGTSRHNN